MEILLLGSLFVVVASGCGFIMEIRLGILRKLLLAAAALTWFSLSAAEPEGPPLKVGVLLEADGDGSGTKFVILRSGSLGLGGPRGGFFSGMLFSGAPCLRGGSPED